MLGERSEKKLKGGYSIRTLKILEVLSTDQGQSSQFFIPFIPISASTSLAFKKLILKSLITQVI